MSDYTQGQLRKLDGLIEMHVFGRKIVAWDFPHGEGPCCEVVRNKSQDEEHIAYVEMRHVPHEGQDEEPIVHVGMRRVLHYTTDWRHAGWVLEWLAKNVDCVCIDTGTEAWYSESEGREAVAHTLPLAICLHALMVTGVDVAKELET
jgi:hypothetical protein